MRAALAIVLALLAAACSSLPAPPPARPQQGAAIARAATALIGTPYQFGGADAAGFDCSGLARYVHERAGLAIPRTAAEQQRAAHPVPLKQLQPGDLVFFRIRKRGIDHVGDRKSTRLNSSHLVISYAVFCLKKKNTVTNRVLSKELHNPVEELVPVRDHGEEGALHFVPQRHLCFSAATGVVDLRVHTLRRLG